MERILSAIACLKQELDAIDEDLHMYIQKTMDAESQLLWAREKVKILVEDEKSSQISIISQERRLHSVELLLEKSLQYVMQEEKELQHVENSLQETSFKSRSSREEFISSCSLFQKQLESISSKRQILIKERDNLNAHIRELLITVDDAKVSEHSILEEKICCYKQLTHRNQGIIMEV
ncbi:hypothetical protein KP509_30G024100 [Ceratopteris richardii]|uniref:Uncharacterized protein n=1 Tax=Ceratopteris richardii TaxID=49495 RepID=A0A8T2R2Y9_CERRI|nr:hypothetical protein KP509_30G024100 [Ceratopteris richardii]